LATIAESGDWCTPVLALMNTAMADLNSQQMATTCRSNFLTERQE
jgi:hypothetical protein